MRYHLAMQAKDNDYDKVGLTPNGEGLTIYEKIGFIRLG